MQDNLVQTLTATREKLDRQIEELLRDLHRARSARGKITEGLVILGEVGTFPKDELQEATPAPRRLVAAVRDWATIHAAIDEFGLARKTFKVSEVLDELARRGLWDGTGSEGGFAWAVRKFLHANGYALTGVGNASKWTAPAIGVSA